MNFADVVNNRYSCRRFLDKPVNEADVKDIVALAQRAPSWGNTQPWKCYVVGGDKAVELRGKLVEALKSGSDENPDVVMPATFEGQLMERYRDLGKAMFATLGIGRDDKDKRLAHYVNNFDAFGAPALVYVTVPAGQTPYVIYDAGALVAQLCLAATDKGLDTCILAALARYAAPVHEVAGIPDDEEVVIGVALGHGDPDAPANKFRSDRAPLDDMLTLIGF